MKYCKRCDQHKPVDEFSRNRSRPDGLNFYCKPCDAARRSSWYQVNKTRINALNIEYGRRKRAERIERRLKAVGRGKS